MDKEVFKKQLEQEGFKHIYEWKDGPGTEYPQHEHQDKVSLYVVDGSATFEIEGQRLLVSGGERFDVPPKTKHIAKVGPEGCEFVVGEMIDGDS